MPISLCEFVEGDISVLSDSHEIFEEPRNQHKHGRLDSSMNDVGSPLGSRVGHNVGFIVASPIRRGVKVSMTAAMLGQVIDVTLLPEMPWYIFLELLSRTIANFKFLQNGLNGCSRFIPLSEFVTSSEQPNSGNATVRLTVRYGIGNMARAECRPRPTTARSLLRLVALRFSGFPSFRGWHLESPRGFEHVDRITIHPHFHTVQEVIEC